MYQLSSSAFALLIVDVEEFHDNKLRRSYESPACEKLYLPNLNITRKDMTHSVISIDSIILNSMSTDSSAVKVLDS